MIDLEPGETKAFTMEIPKGKNKIVLEVAWTCGGCKQENKSSQTLYPTMGRFNLDFLIYCPKCEPWYLILWQRLRHFFTL